MAQEFGEYYQTQQFSDLYPTVDLFIADYKNQNPEFVNGIPTIITDANATTLYYLLYSKFGNSHIANFDLNQFKYRLFGLIFQYGPTWERKLGIQASLRSLQEADLITGSKTINSHAYNPSTEVEGGPNPDGDEITTINEQTKSRTIKSKLDGYAYLWDLLTNDVTEEFLNKFKQLFLVVVEPQKPLWYESED